MYSDMLKAKDEVISTLTDQLYKSEQGTRELGSRSNSFDQPDVVQSLLPRDSTGSGNLELKELERYKVVLNAESTCVFSWQLHIGFLQTA